jgi:adenine phosphoribosyltransferase
VGVEAGRILPTGASDVAAKIRSQFRFVGEVSDPSAWWRDASLLTEIPAALAELHRAGRPTVVAGVEARGFVLGPLVAARLGVGFAEIRKDLHPNDLGEKRLLRRTTPPDYQKRSLVLTARPSLFKPRDRVLLVDDWIETGAQAIAVRDLVEDAEADWVGVAVIVDALPSEMRRRLNVLALIRERELPW